MTAVPMQRTAISLEDARPVLVAALNGAGIEPTNRVVAYALATFALENRSGASVWNFNWGNVTSQGRESDRFWRPTWYEVTEASSDRDKLLHGRMLEGKAPKAFAARLNHVQGAAAFVRALYTQRPAVLRAAQRGDVSAYAAAIHDTAYCPDPECEGPRTAPRYVSLLNDFVDQGLASPGAVLPRARSVWPWLAGFAAVSIYAWRKVT